MELKDLFDKINSSLGVDDYGRPRWLTPIDMERLRDYVTKDGMAVEVLYEAFASAIEQEAEKPKAYMWSVLRVWRKSGIKTLDDVANYREAFEEKKAQSKNKATSNVPSWSNPNYKAPTYEEILKSLE